MNRELQYLDLFPSLTRIFDDIFEDSFKLNKKFFPNDNQTYPKYNIIAEYAKDSPEVESFEVRLAVPGFKKENLTVSMKDHLLEIIGKEENKEEHYMCKGFSTKGFKQSIIIPENYKIVEEWTRLEDGILKILFKLNKTPEQEHLIEIK